MSDPIEIQEQQPAPDFTLPAITSDESTTEEQIHLADLRGKNVVLYFYPKDDTPGCTIEACSFRDANHELKRRGVVLLGISADNEKSHKKFANKFQLPFPLLADVGANVAKEYGVYKEKSMFGKKYMGVDRQTFLIDKDGVVRKVWRKVKPDGHADEVLEAVDAL
jgi:peroxiredoxin Q/BCP